MQPPQCAARFRPLNKQMNPISRAMTEFEKEWRKMLEGEIYDAVHPEFGRLLTETRDMLWEYNNLKPSDMDRQREILHSLLGSHGQRFHFNQPFRCDYGQNIFIGDNFFANFNLTILDEAKVTFGNNVFIGPNVSIYTACHPLDSTTRNTGAEWALPVTIGDNVWIGGSVTILPGVTIGSDTVIGAGSVVTRDIPSSCVAAGNPARPIKTLPKS